MSAIRDDVRGLAFRQQRAILRAPQFIAKVNH